jgi:hypothetical protein
MGDWGPEGRGSPGPPPGPATGAVKGARGRGGMPGCGGRGGEWPWAGAGVGPGPAGGPGCSSGRGPTPPAGTGPGPAEITAGWPAMPTGTGAATPTGTGAATPVTTQRRRAGSRQTPLNSRGAVSRLHTLWLQGAKSTSRRGMVRAIPALHTLPVTCCFPNELRTVHCHAGEPHSGHAAMAPSKLSRWGGKVGVAPGTPPAMTGAPLGLGPGPCAGAKPGPGPDKGPWPWPWP